MVDTLSNRALNWTPPPGDPLILDLDGNGITTSGIDPRQSIILFDHNANGIKTASGWVAAGEGILVRDINANGFIDTGRELFGDNTLLTRGARAGQLAANGFEALADLDSNGDAQFDALDAEFANLKLWKDLNQDGISQSEELFSLTALGVQSIQLNATTARTDLGGGNTQTMTASFTHQDAEGVSTQKHVGNLLLSNNDFYREFTDVTGFRKPTREPKPEPSPPRPPEPTLRGFLCTRQFARQRAYS